MTESSILNSIIIPALVPVAAFFLVVLMAPRFIPMLRRMKFGQEVRDDGPEAHLKKQGTPTMGGIMFLISVTVTVLIKNAFAPEPESLMVLFLVLGFGLVGALDDWLKIKKHQSEGLNPRQKLLLQLALTVIFALWVYYHGVFGGRILIPFGALFGSGLKLELPVWLYIPFVVFVVLGTDNGVNFTDGLDGLCSSVTVVTAIFFAAAGLIFSQGVTVVSLAVTGSLMGFLLFNVYPAKIFMGDTGSLALGGFVSAAAVVSGLELFIPIVGFIYMIEVISVIIQVSYFKLTHGKRVFRMAPIHHHFEIIMGEKGETVTEPRIVAAFTCTTALLGFAAFVILLFFTS
ncbi:MAG: phospho-N-acetylmuramoyl-pentapeptide-transferase [Candidatus Avilachnospira sp.]|jgi:phospho-N-acetylmuramoyl-pentapeptide-transferase